MSDSRQAAPADAEKPAPEEPAGEPQSGSAEGKAGGGRPADPRTSII